MPSTPAVLVIAPRPGDSPELKARLGAERWAELQPLMMRRCMSWAEEIASEAVLVCEGDEGVGAAAERARAEGAVDAPLLIAWPELPRWRRELGQAALGDLEAGCDLSLGPVFDGGFYLVAMARPLPSVLALPALSSRAPDAIGLAVAAANEGEAPVGLLRAERGLRTPADLQAALADPLLDSELRELLDYS